ncbi:MAG: PAS domain-containing sensor histidine kinase [Bacteroidales bacterium]|jgi:nitrogen-specific signal transduction histidine kinase|nr:PAS domain-containing sensor histidine kinase [Bacteroidales bacterium]
MRGSLLTCFASAERSPQDEILRQHSIITDNKDLIVFLNGIVSMVTVLNSNRQVVFANSQTLSAIGVDDENLILGQRLGEVFGCEHAHEVNGCGTSPHCSVCGAVRTMLLCKNKAQSIDECSLTNGSTKTSLDLRVHSTYTTVNNENFIICSLFDISDEKRRGVMERIFFHDIMNTINGINGIAQVLKKVDPSKQDLYMSHLTRMLDSLVDEINSHRVLTLAEKDEYKIKYQELHSLDFLIEEMENLNKAAALEMKEIRISPDSEDHVFCSDKVLLSRVLCNMIKNALEAECAGAVIEIGVHKGDDDNLHFHVHNDAVMSRKTSLQVFSRSFSTKGEDRGLGTYSMKLLSEKYLNGTIGFVSNKVTGTVFTVKIPVSVMVQNRPENLTGSEIKLNADI